MMAYALVFFCIAVAGDCSTMKLPTELQQQRFPTLDSCIVARAKVADEAKGWGLFASCENTYPPGTK